MEIFVPLLGVFVASAAIVLNNYFALEREKRKEYRARVDEILNSISDVERLIIKFHTSSTYNAEVASDITWKLDRLAKYMQMVSYFNTDELKTAFVSFKKSATANNFGASKFLTQPHSSEIIRDVHSSATLLSQKVLKIYSEKHTI